MMRPAVCESEVCFPSSRFTGKERDAESGNDYFGARYYGSSMGRMLSPDPMGPWVADVSDPQSWNFYAYARNNPLINTDPTGLDCVYFNDAGNGIESVDRHSDSGECGKNGGDWVNGTLRAASYFSDSDTWGFGSNDSQNNYLTYAHAPGPGGGGTDSNGNPVSCSGNCDIANGYSQTPIDNSWGATPIAPSAQQLVQKVAQQTAPVNKALNCAGAGAIAFSPVTTPSDASDVSGALAGQGTDAAEKGLDALSDVKALSKGVRVGSKYLGKAAGLAGKGLAVHSAYENMKEAGCFGGGAHQ
jgi:RHS repeat-associated protein